MHALCMSSQRCRTPKCPAGVSCHHLHTRAVPALRQLPRAALWVGALASLRNYPGSWSGQKLNRGPGLAPRFFRGGVRGAHRPYAMHLSQLWFWFLPQSGDVQSSGWCLLSELIQDKEAPERGTGEPLGFLQKAALLQPWSHLCSGSGVSQKPRVGSSGWAAPGKCSKQGSHWVPGSQGGLLECAPCKREGKEGHFFGTTKDSAGSRGQNGTREPLVWFSALLADFGQGLALCASLFSSLGWTYWCYCRALWCLLLSRLCKNCSLLLLLLTLLSLPRQQGLSCVWDSCLAGLWETHSLHGLSALQVEPQACTYPCQCPSQPLQCPAGTSHVLDACGCCKVCARQLGELCSLQKPCDHHKGLYCDFSKIHRGSGICLGERRLFCCYAVFLWPLQPPQKAPSAQNFLQLLGTDTHTNYFLLQLRTFPKARLGAWGSPLSLGRAGRASNPVVPAGKYQPAGLLLGSAAACNISPQISLPCAGDWHFALDCLRARGVTRFWLEHLGGNSRAGHL